MLDETRSVRKSSALLPEPVLKRCERAWPTGKLHPSAPDCGGNMRPSKAPPARYQDAAKNDEQNKN
jgi:hypothetical protein